MKIERVFNPKSELKLEDIVNSLINENIDKYIDKYYNSDKVSFTASHEKGGHLS